jgi:hypothetical protein
MFPIVQHFHQWLVELQGKVHSDMETPLSVVKVCVCQSIILCNTVCMQAVSALRMQTLQCACNDIHTCAQYTSTTSDTLCMRALRYARDYIHAYTQHTSKYSANWYAVACACIRIDCSVVECALYLLSLVPVAFALSFCIAAILCC